MYFSCYPQICESIIRHLESKDESDTEIQTMKAVMLSSLTNRYSDVENNEALIIVSFYTIDSYCKDRCFNRPVTTQNRL